MYKDYITTDDLDRYISNLKKLKLAMNKFDLEKLGTRCNTYGMTSDFISIAGVGFLPLYDEVADYYDYDEFGEVEGYSEDDIRWELERIDEED